MFFRNSAKASILGISLADALFTIAGSALYACAFVFFLSPNNTTPGGVTGISFIINHFVPNAPMGVLIILINVPIFLFGWRIEGHTFLIKSIIGTIVSSVCIDLLQGVYAYTDDHLLSALCGGVLMGVGLGLIFSRGATTGGSDIVARLLNHRFPGLSVGRLILIVDAIIVLGSAVAFGHINFALYSVVAVYVSSLVIDSILYGVESARVAYIITANTGAVVSAIDRELDRGATLLQGVGSYSNQPRDVIMCAIKRRQIATLKTLVRNIDPNSFVILVEAHEVLGQGFKRHFGR